MEEIEYLPDRIFDNYLNATIFLTGGTGFLGKVLIERLLRVFDVKRIYILIREKKGKFPFMRLRDIFSDPLFNQVRNLKGEQIFKKCTALSGDICKDGLDLLPEDREILQDEVEYVLNTAGNIKFDDPLKKALLTNAKGALSMIELARGMKKLKLFIHVSTAYSHPEQKILEEKLYPIKYDYEKLISLSEYFDRSTMEAMRETFMKDIPNTYTVSKAVGEAIVAKAIASLPIVIMRPTIVISMWKGPLAGWTDNINGPAGGVIGCGTGIMRTMYAYKDMHADLVCVDFVADSILVLSAYSLQNQLPNGRVFNISSHNQISLTWKQCKDMSIKINKEKIPFDIFLWVPNTVVRTSRIMYYIDVLLWQLIPAWIIDEFLPFFGYKPMLWKAQMRIQRMLRVLEFYINNEWTFLNHHSVEARAWLNAKELSKYTLSQSDLDPEAFIENQVLGLRRYILKEPDENLPNAKRSMTIMIWVDRIWSIVLKLLLAYVFYSFVISKIYNWV